MTMLRINNIFSEYNLNVKITEQINFQFQEEVVRILVDNGGSVNVQSQNGFTPLYMAAQVLICFIFCSQISWNQVLI